MVIDVNKIIYSNSEKEYAKFSKSLCKSKYEIIGVRIPILRNIAKNIIKEDKEFIYKLDEIENKYFETVMLKGFIIAYSNVDYEQRLNYIDSFIKYIDNWSICDSFCATLKFVNKNKENFWEYIKEHLNCKGEFELRFLIVMILDYYVDKQYLNEIFNIVNSIDGDKYYVQMGIAWLISLCYIRYPEETMGFLIKCNLDEFTFNKSIQKILESYRVDESEKVKLRKLKK